MTVLANAVEAESTENLLELFEDYQTWVNTQVLAEDSELRLFTENLFQDSNLTSMLAVALEVSAQLVQRAYQ